jgi:CRP-like cAMP-binding protein
MDTTAKYSGTSEYTGYINGLYFAVSLLTTTGMGDFVPATSSEAWLFMGACVVAKILWAGVIGYSSIYALNKNRGNEKLLSKLNYLVKYMANRMVHPSLRYRVLEYHSYVTNVNSIVKSHTYAESLAPDLRALMKEALYGSVVNQFLTVDWGSYQDKLGLLKGICNTLEPAVFLPGEIVIHRKCLGERMYLIKSGEARVLMKAEDDGSILTDLKEGDYFGEVAFLLQPPDFTQVCHTAVVVSVTLLQTVTLNYRDWLKLLKSFPADHQRSLTDALLFRASEEYEDLNTAMFRRMIKPSKNLRYSESSSRYTEERVSGSIGAGGLSPTGRNSSSVRKSLNYSREVDLSSQDDEQLNSISEVKAMTYSSGSEGSLPGNTLHQMPSPKFSISRGFSVSQQNGMLDNDENDPGHDFFSRVLEHMELTPTGEPMISRLFTDDRQDVLPNNNGVTGLTLPPILVAEEPANPWRIK